MSSEYSKINKSELAFHRNATARYWNTKYDAPKRNCPWCGANLEKNRSTIACVIQEPDNTDYNTTERTCSDCDSEYVEIFSLSGPTQVSSSIDIEPKSPFDETKWS